MKIDVRYIDDKFMAMRSNGDYKNVSNVIDYVVIQKYDVNERTSSNTPSGYGNKIDFPIGKRSIRKSFSKGIQENYVKEAIKYIENLKPIKPGERVWIDLISRFLNADGEELYEKELHGGIWVDVNNYETELDSFINELTNLITKPVSDENIGTIKRLNRKRKYELKDLI